MAASSSRWHVRRRPRGRRGGGGGGGAGAAACRAGVVGPRTRLALPASGSGAWAPPPPPPPFRRGPPRIEGACRAPMGGESAPRPAPGVWDALAHASAIRARGRATCPSARGDGLRGCRATRPHDWVAEVVALLPRPSARGLLHAPPPSLGHHRATAALPGAAAAASRCRRRRRRIRRRRRRCRPGCRGGESAHTHAQGGTPRAHPRPPSKAGATAADGCCCRSPTGASPPRVPPHHSVAARPSAVSPRRFPPPPTARARMRSGGGGGWWRPGARTPSRRTSRMAATGTHAHTPLRARRGDGGCVARGGGGVGGGSGLDAAVSQTFTARAVGDSWQAGWSKWRATLATMRHASLSAQRVVLHVCTYVRHGRQNSTVRVRMA